MDLAVVGAPARPLAVDDDLDEARAQLLLRLLGLLGRRAVRRAEDRLHVTGLEAVGEVVRHELVRRGDDDRADLVAREDDGPELVVPLQDEHHLVALADAERLQVVRRAVRVLRHVLEREAALRHVVGDVQHRQPLRVAPRDLVDDVEGEVEALRVLEDDVLQAARLVLLDVDEPLHRLRRGGRLGPVEDRLRRRERDLLAVRRHDHREERAGLAADGDHPVRHGRAVERRVARLQRLLVLADLEAHLAAQDVVVLLAAVGRRRDRAALEGGVVVVRHEVRRRLAVAEERRHVADLDARLARRHDALPGARDLQVGELRRAPFEKRHQVDAEDERALVQEGERRIALGRLDRAALRLRHARPRRQLGLRQALDLAHLADAGRDAPERFLCFDRIHFVCFFLVCLVRFPVCPLNQNGPSRFRAGPSACLM